LPLRFEANHGQFDGDVRFLARARGYSLALTANGPEMFIGSSLPGESRLRVQAAGHRLADPTRLAGVPLGSAPKAGVRMHLIGAEAGREPEGTDRLPGVTNYLLGSDPTRWHTSVPAYAAVRYTRVYPGVDLVFHDGGTGVEYDFEIAPGTAPSAITWQFEGAGPPMLDKGDLVLNTPAGALRQRRPAAYQMVDGRRRAVVADFALRPSGTVGFSLGAHDARRPVVIDPVLSYSTYLGGVKFDRATNVAVDTSGNAYVVGQTDSANLPTTPGAFQAACPPGGTCALTQAHPAFVAKLAPDGSALEYLTYLGGSADNQTDPSIAVDGQGDAVVAGATQSVDFPTTPGAPQRSCGGDAFCDADRTDYADGATTAGSTTFTAAGPRFTTGNIGSPITGANLPPGTLVTAVGPLDPASGASTTATLSQAATATGTALPFTLFANPRPDAFVAKLDPTGASLLASTYLGGSGIDSALGIALDGAADVYVAGVTSAVFPTTAGALQANRVLNDGVTVAGSTTLTSGSATFGAADVGRPVVAGTLASATVISAVTGAHSVTLSVPATASASGVTVTIGGPSGAPGTFTFNAFAAKLSPEGALAYSTYLGGTDSDAATGVAVDGTCTVACPAFVTGATTSADIPTTAGAFRTACHRAKASPPGSCSQEGFVAELDGAGAHLAYGTFLGGSGSDAGSGIAVRPSCSPSCEAYVTGSADSADFPTTPGAYQRLPVASGGETATFVTKLDPNGSALLYSTFIGGNGSATEPPGIAMRASGDAVVAGTTSRADFPTVLPVQGAYGGGFADAFVSELNFDGSALVFSSFLGGSGEDQGYGVALDNADNLYVTGDTVSIDFPTVGALQPVNQGAGGGDERDAFVAKLSPAQGPLVAKVAPPSGVLSGGTPVVLSGIGFAGATSVRFGEAPAASFAVVSDTQIDAVSPPGDGGPVPVVVSAGSGTSPANPASLFSYGEGSWASALPERTARQQHTATLLPGGKVLVVGGEDASQRPLAGAELYDPVSGQWRPAQPMKVARSQHTATLLADGKVLVAGGQGTTGALRSAELFDPATGKWTPTADMTVARGGHTATLVSGPGCGPNCAKVLVAGGAASDTPVASTELYDPSTGTWASAADLSDARSAHAAALLPDGMVLVAGGLGQTGVLASAETFDPATGPAGMWRRVNDMNSPRQSPAATVLPTGAVLVAAGTNGTPLDTAEIFQPDGSWRLTGIMQVPRSGPTATLLPNGHVLLAGGFTGGALASAEVYDPDDDQWRPAGIMSVARGTPPGSPARRDTSATATLLSSDTGAFAGDMSACGDRCGRVLVVGGSDVVPTNAVDIYTPAPAVTAVDPREGPPGTVVTISGSGFTTGTTVRFGDQPPIPATVTSSTELTVLSPPSPAGPLDVVVTARGGSSPATPADLFTALGRPPLNKPVVGMAATPTGKGYWLVAADGGIFTFGDARFFGSTGGAPLNKPVVGMAATPTGKGYWLVAADGGIFTFGDAPFFGSTGGAPLNKPVVGMAATPTGKGYWLVAADGGIFTFGDARFFGSTGGAAVAQPAVGRSARSATAG